MACVSSFTHRYDQITNKKQLNGAGIYLAGDLWRDAIQHDAEGVAAGGFLLVGSQRSLPPCILAEQEAERSARNQD